MKRIPGAFVADETEFNISIPTASSRPSRRRQKPPRFPKKRP
jgi:hypothetical protein